MTQLYRLTVLQMSNFCQKKFRKQAECKLNIDMLKTKTIFIKIININLPIYVGRHPIEQMPELKY